MIALGADLDQLDKISGSLGPLVIFADSRKRIPDDNFSQSVQGRFSTRHNRDLRLEEKIKLAGERCFCTTRAFGHCLNAAQRLGAPGNDQAGVTEFAFAKKNRRRGLHGENLARDPCRGKQAGRPHVQQPANPSLE